MVKSGAYKPPFWLLNSHFETVVPAVFRRVGGLDFQRESITTRDGDFLDLDMLISGNDRLAIISHGLEGNSRRPYMTGMARHFSRNGYDVCNWNFRSCSGRMNRTLGFYHSGMTEDLSEVISYGLARGYGSIVLIGFSLGGNMTIKYLGEDRVVPPEVRAAVAISVPMDLAAGSKRISRPDNRLYEWRFLRHLGRKIRVKAKSMPLDTAPLGEVKTLRDFDDYYTAPLHGFHGAEDYYQRNSSMSYVQNTDRPLLIINARNDSFLTKRCYPEDYPEQGNVEWDVPERGGHVGFSRSGPYYSEVKALAFAERFL